MDAVQGRGRQHKVTHYVCVLTCPTLHHNKDYYKVATDLAHCSCAAFRQTRCIFCRRRNPWRNKLLNDGYAAETWVPFPNIQHRNCVARGFSASHSVSFAVHHLETPSNKRRADIGSLLVTTWILQSRVDRRIWSSPRCARYGAEGP